MYDLLVIAEAIHQFALATWPKTVQQATDIGFLEYMALDQLSKLETATVGEIKTRIHAMPAQMSRLVRSMEDKGLITSRLNRADKRKIDLKMTKAGLKAYHKFRSARLSVLVEALETLTEQEQQQVFDIVQKMNAALSTGTPAASEADPSDS